MRRQGSPQTPERVRHAAVELWRQGVSPQQIAVALDRHLGTVDRWLAMVRDQGADRLAARRPVGAPLKLSIQQRESLIEQLLQGASEHGFSTDLWTAPRVQPLIRQQCGVEYHVHDIPNLLKSLNFTPQKPEIRARERNDAEIEH